MKQIWVLAITMILGSGSTTWAAPQTAQDRQGGLGTNYTKILVKNLPIGQTISMTKIAKLPMKIMNGFDVTITANVEFSKPETPKAGYEPIPDPSWLQADSRTVTIPASAVYTTDVKLTIPDDEKLFGRQFQGDIEVSTEGDPALTGFKYGYSVKGFFLFSVAPQRNDQALAAAIKNPADATYELMPPRVDLYGVKAGEIVKVLGPERKPIALNNLGKKKRFFTLEAVNPAETAVTPDGGCQIGNPGDVMIKNAKLTVGAKKGQPVEIEVRILQTVDLKLGPQFYLVRVAGSSPSGIEQFIKIYCWGIEDPKIKKTPTPEVKAP